MSWIYWSPNQVSMSTGCSKKLQQSQSTPTSLYHNGKTQQQCMFMPIQVYSSVHQPDSQVNNCSMCPPLTWTTAFNRGRHWSTALLMSCWSRLAQHVHTLSLRSSRPTIRRTELWDIPVNFSISLGLLLYRYPWLVLEDVIGSDVAVGVFWPTLYLSIYLGIGGVSVTRW